MAELENQMMKMMGVVMVAGVGMSIIQPLLAAAEEEEEGEPSGMLLQIISLTGPLSSAVAFTPLQASIDVFEYETYLVRATITNLSTRAGQPVAATLTHRIVVVVNNVTLVDSGLVPTDYAASGSQTFDYQFTVPAGAAGALQLAALSSLPSPCGSYGDVDGNGYVTITDSAMIKQYLAGQRTLTFEQLQRADVTGDGQVSITDALTIEQYLTGAISTFPACTAAGGLGQASGMLYDPNDNLLASAGLGLNVLPSPLMVDITTLHARPAGSAQWTQITGAETVEWNIGLGFWAAYTNLARYPIYTLPEIVVTDPQNGTQTLEGSSVLVGAGLGSSVVLENFTMDYEGVYTVDVTIKAKKALADDWEIVAVKQWQFLVSAEVEYGGGIEVGG